jgi:peroxiredoxin
LLVFVAAAVLSTAEAQAQVKKGDNALAKDYGQKDLFGAEAMYWLSSFVGPDAGEGKKEALLLSFCHSSCEACWEELPSLIELKKKYGSEGVEIWSVLVDDDDEGRAIGKKKLAPARDVFVVTRMAVPAMADAYLGRPWVMPALFLIDGDGRVRLVLQGKDTKNQKKLEKEVRSLVE